MPRVNVGGRSQAKTPGAKALEKTIIEYYGIALNMVNLMAVLGLKDRGQAKLWLEKEKLQSVEVNGRKRWLASDVAAALDNSKFRT